MRILKSTLEIAIVFGLAIKTIALDFRQRKEANTEVKSIVPNVTMTKENIGKTLASINKFRETIT